LPFHRRQSVIEIWSRLNGPERKGKTMLEERTLPSATTSSVVEQLFHRPEQPVAGVVASATPNALKPTAGGLSSREREFRKLNLAAATANRIKAIPGTSVAADRAHAEGGIPTAIHRPERSEMETRDCVYNLFRNKQRPEILCAVPEDRPVPNFVVAEQWSVLRPLRPSDISPAGFQPRAASAGVRFNGFHLFQVTARDGFINP
jgi:hypothetical protein